MTEVLVVHCVDTEGPLGGDARRRPDGSKEFFDDWDDILESLRELTADRFRRAHNDYRFNWFCLDFTGFRTNPKQKVTAYHDAYDRLRSLPTAQDGFYWHHHVPPASGAGDEWSDTWLSSNEANTILARRLIERGDFPEAFRAGGTIEDQAASFWLERVCQLDFSNRVSERSRPGAPLSDFGWFGAPAEWAPYHPSHASFLEPGRMRRLVYRSLDLRSRVNELTEAEALRAFAHVGETGEPAVLSYFSHDCRDMRAETYDVAWMLSELAERTGVPWRSCTAVEAHRRFHGLVPERVALELEPVDCGLLLRTDREPFQPEPFFAAELPGGRIVRLFPKRAGENEWLAPGPFRRYGAAVTSASGDKTVRVVGPAKGVELGDLFEALRPDERQFHPHPLTRGEAERLARYDGPDVYAAVVDSGCAVGYGLLRGWEEGYEVPSLGIAVHPEARGLGVAGTLMGYLHAAARERGARRVRLRVYPDNEPARRLYDRLGYRFDGQEDGQLVGYLEL
jgi:GNAT superfamily N-acetyltransferase